MSLRAWLPILLAPLAGCDVPAIGQAPNLETLRVAIGMPVGAFNEQDIVRREARRLSPGTLGTFTIGAPHILEVTLNGQSLRFDGGGRNAYTMVGNLFQVSLRAPSEYDRVGSIIFDTSRELVTLAEALALSRRICAQVRAAGLHPSVRYFAYIDERLGPRHVQEVGGETALREAFSSQETRAIQAYLCNVEDARHSFQLGITNYRRSAQRYRGGGDESDPSGERQYRVKAFLSQNISRLRCQVTKCTDDEGTMADHPVT